MSAHPSPACVVCGCPRDPATWPKAGAKCRPCLRAHSRAYMAEYLKRDGARERQRARHDAWAAKHPDHAKASHVRYYYKNVAARRANAKAWRDRNRERNLATKAKWRAANSDRSKAVAAVYRAKNQPKMRAKEERRRALKYGKPFVWSKTDQADALAHFGGACAACCIPVVKSVNLHWDHWVPLIAEDSPGTVPSNMVPLCAKCNSSKEAIRPADWAVRRFGQVVGCEVLRRVENFLSRKKEAA